MTLTCKSFIEKPYIIIPRAINPYIIEAELPRAINESMFGDLLNNLLNPTEK